MQGRLTAAALKNVKATQKAKKLTDGGGLYLYVTPNGARSWRYDYRADGRRKTVTLGRYPEISLSRARQLHFEARSKVMEGRDPAAEKRACGATDRLTFKAVAEEWLELNKANWSEKHLARVIRALYHDLFPSIGRASVESVDAPAVLNALRKIEQRGAIDTAKKTKQIASQIFRYAVITGRAKGDPTAALAGALKPHHKVHRAAITTPSQLKQLLIAIDNYSGSFVLRSALQFSALTFQRPGEIRNIEWSEINWEERRWEIPSSKMKASRDHIVPLSRQSTSLLRKLEPLAGCSKYVFPNARSRQRPMSDNGVRTALRTLGYSNEDMTPHGFRATARTILDEVLHYRIDLIEHQLAHAVKDATGRAYNRTSHLTGRAEMMQGWADYLDELRGVE